MTIFEQIRGRHDHIWVIRGRHDHIWVIRGRHEPFVLSGHGEPKIHTTDNGTLAICDIASYDGIIFHTPPPILLETGGVGDEQYTEASFLGINGSDFLNVTQGDGNLSQPIISSLKMAAVVVVQYNIDVPVRESTGTFQWTVYYWQPEFIQWIGPWRSCTLFYKQHFYKQPTLG